MSLTVDALVTITLSDSSEVGSGTLTDSVDLSALLNFVDGTGALGVQVQYRGARTLAGSSETLDLAGSLLNPKSKTVTLTKVKGILLRADDANAGNLVFTFNTTNGFTTAVNGAITLHPGAVHLLATPAANGWTVTAGTGDAIGVGGAAGYAYEVVIWGEGSEA